MPGKKKKHNARFPPARIKKIMQTDEEVGKVAAAVPVIISRALELFAETLLARANEVTSRRGARTLTPSHLKLCIETERRFDFLKELVTTVPDLQDDELEPEGEMLPLQPSRGKARGRGGRPLNLTHSNSERARSADVPVPATPPVIRGKKRGRPPKVRNGLEHSSERPTKLRRPSLDKRKEDSIEDQQKDSPNGHGAPYPPPGRLGGHVPPFGRTNGTTDGPTAGRNNGRPEQVTPAPFEFIYRPEQGELASVPSCGRGTVSSCGPTSRVQPMSRSMSLPGAPRQYPDPRAVAGGRPAPFNLEVSRPAPFENQPLDLKIPGLSSPVKVMHSAGIISPGIRSAGIIPPGSAGVVSPGSGNFYLPGANLQPSPLKKSADDERSPFYPSNHSSPSAYPFIPSPSLYTSKTPPSHYSTNHSSLPPSPSIYSSNPPSVPPSPTSTLPPSPFSSTETIASNTAAIGTTSEPQSANKPPATDVNKPATNGDETAGAVSLPQIESGTHSFIRSLSSACRGPSSMAVARTLPVKTVTVKRDVVDEDYDC